MGPMGRVIAKPSCLVYQVLVPLLVFTLSLPAWALRVESPVDTGLEEEIHQALIDQPVVATSLGVPSDRAGGKTLTIARFIQRETAESQAGLEEQLRSEYLKLVTDRRVFGRTGEEARETVFLFEVYETIFDGETKAKLSSRSKDPQYGMYLATAEEIRQKSSVQISVLREDKTVSVEARIANNAAALLPEAENAIRREDWIATLGHGIAKPSIRVGSGGLARVRLTDPADGQEKYLLVLNADALKRGEYLLTPLGGAIGITSEGLAFLESLGVTHDDFVDVQTAVSKAKAEAGKDSRLLSSDQVEMIKAKAERSLRFILATDNLPKYLAWFITRRDRETDILRELKEEIVDEGSILSPEEWEAISKKTAAGLEEGNTLRYGDGRDGSGIRDLVFHPDGQRIAFVSFDQTFQQMELSSGRIISSQFKEQDFTGRPMKIRYSPDGRFMAVSLRNGEVRLVDAASGKTARYFQHGEWADALAFSPDGRWLVSGGLDGMLRFWPLKEGDRPFRIQAFSEAGNSDNWVTAVAFRRDVRRMIALSYAGRLVCFDISGEEPRLLWKNRLEHTRQTYALSWSPNGEWIATGGPDRTALIWRASDGALRWVLDGFPEGIGGIVFSPDGKEVILAGDDGDITVQELPQPGEGISPEHRRLLPDREDGTHQATALAFSPDGAVLAIGRNRGVIWLEPWFQVRAGMEEERAKADALRRILENLENREGFPRAASGGMEEAGSLRDILSGA